MKDKIITGAEVLKAKGLFYLSAVEYSIAFHRSLLDRESLNPVHIFSELEIRKIVNGIKSEMSNIEKVLSYGSRWNEDEFMLIYTFLMKYRLLFDYFQYYKLSVDLLVDEVLDSILRVLKDEKNYNEASKAKRMIMKNRKDLSTEWLEKVLL